MTLTGPAPTITRDRWGRPMIVPLRGNHPVPYTRATTIAKTLDDASGLTRWKQRQTAIGLAMRPDLLAAVASTSPEDKKALDQTVEAAMEAAGSSSAATVGTALHAFTERLDRGLDLGVVPTDLIPDIAAYSETVSRAGWKTIDVERFLVNHGLKIAGTTDRVVELDGVRYIADLKTSQSIDFHHAFAVQLGIYAHCLPYDIEAQTTLPWEKPPSTDLGIIIHAPSHSGTATLHWIDIAAGWDAVRLATAVRRWRARRDLLRPLETAPADPVLGAIAHATSVDELNLVWAAHQTVWTDDHTAAAAARKKELS